MSSLTDFLNKWEKKLNMDKNPNVAIFMENQLESNSNKIWVTFRSDKSKFYKTFIDSLTNYDVKIEKGVNAYSRQPQMVGVTITVKNTVSES